MYKAGVDRRQLVLFPTNLDAMIPAGHAVRVIDAFVDGLDMEVLGFRKCRPAKTGTPPYDPKDLYKLYLYGYINHIRTSRRLNRECRRNIEVMWLIGGLTPDFRTIADFRAFNKGALKRAFRLFVMILREEGLLGNELTVDGTKIRANNSIKKSFTPEVTQKKLEYIEAQIAQFEAYLTDMDAREAERGAMEFEIPKEGVALKLEDLKRRAGKYRAYQKRFAEGETQILETDPECRTLHSKDGLHPAYNIQTVVDTKNHFITNYETTVANTDQNQLSEMGEAAKAELHREVVHLIADKGYDSRADIEKCLMNGIIPDVGLKYDKDERVFNLDYVEPENGAIAEEVKQSTKPEDIQRCLHAGVLPACYENTNIAVEVQKQEQISCFLRHADGRVTCPMGRELFKHRDLKYGVRYGRKEACRTCPHRCTESKDTKTVSIGYNTNCVPILMYGNPKFPVQQIPKDAIISPNNHALDRKKSVPQKVKLTIRKDIRRQQIRKETAEHPFGTIKWYHGAYFFLTRGKEKVSAETALSYTGYNLIRAINLTTPDNGGVPGILMRLKQRKWEKWIG